MNSGCCNDRVRSLRRWHTLIVAACLALVAACADKPVITEPAPPDLIQPIEVRASRIPEIRIEPAAPVPVDRPAPVKLPEPPSISIVMTGRQPAYDAVAKELGARLENYSIYDLSDKSQPPETAFRLINDSGTGAVVAIGLPAAKSSVQHATVPVIFSQVFNYHDHALVTDKSRGVSALVPLDAQLSAWRDLQPELNHVGMIIGHGHEALVDEAQEAADRYGIRLTVRTAASDQEAQYEFRRMVGEIDGFWLFPDSRVLSNRSLRNMLAQANRRKVSVAVQNESLLPLGATISIAPVAADIAATIVDVIRRIEAGQIGQLPELTPLSAAHVVIY